MRHQVHDKLPTANDVLRGVFDSGWTRDDANTQNGRVGGHDVEKRKWGGVASSILFECRDPSDGTWHHAKGHQFVALGCGEFFKIKNHEASAVQMGFGHHVLPAFELGFDKLTEFLG